jgi:hypothetical protein
MTSNFGYPRVPRWLAKADVADRLGYLNLIVNTACTGMRLKHLLSTITLDFLHATQKGISMAILIIAYCRGYQYLNSLASPRVPCPSSFVSVRPQSYQQNFLHTVPSIVSLHHISHYFHSGLIIPCPCNIRGIRVVSGGLRVSTAKPRNTKLPSFQALAKLAVISPTRPTDKRLGTRRWLYSLFIGLAPSSCIPRPTKAKQSRRCPRLVDPLQQRIPGSYQLTHAWLQQYDIRKLRYGPVHSNVDVLIIADTKSVCCSMCDLTRYWPQSS